ncbi:IS30 family transposase, partial [Mycoplasma sp. 744]|uniref:IS30 family transposase n=1 Tax=Mycoplasma sp. 744 TaxID=3108531 RepID=UPI002B1DDB39
YDPIVLGVEATRIIVESHNKFPVPSLRTLFNWINSGLWALTFKDRLRKQYKKGGKRTGTVVSRLAGARFVLPIVFRPTNVNDRSKFGHWEADLIVGKKGSGSEHLLTFVERKTRYGLIRKVPSKNPWIVAQILFDLIKEKRLNVKSITIDNGLEFKCFFMIGFRLKILIYKADAYASYQKGTVENFNGIVRRYFPKKTNFNKVTEQEIQNVQRKINNMPRQMFDYSSSDELFFDLNYYKEPWKSEIADIGLYNRPYRTRVSNTKRNLFFKKFKK